MREFGIAPNTQIGKIEIEQQVYSKENPFNYDKYCRSAQFLQDLYADNYIEFAERWFHLAGFEDMLNDMDEYFKYNTPIGERFKGEHSNFIKWKDNSIQNDNKNFVIWEDEKQYTNNEAINDNQFIIWDNTKRDNTDVLDTLRNTVQMDIDDIDMIMRRKERMAEEDKELERIIYADDDIHNMRNKEEEEEE